MPANCNITQTSTALFNIKSSQGQSAEYGRTCKILHVQYSDYVM